MTMRTSYPLICQCGHEGNIVLKENDQPFSEMYENYSLEGLNGSSFHASMSGLTEAIQNMNITCPKCGRNLTIKHLKK